MSNRGTQLHNAADRQISGLIDILSSHGETVLPLPCPGREKLGDGTVAATALHAADNYHRIAEFLGAGNNRSSALGMRWRDRHLIPGIAGARGHGSRMHGAGRGSNYRARDIDLPGVLERLSSAREALSILADLTDEQLDAVPPRSEMKFCDGKRTLEQIVGNLLKHQGHQLDALNAAVAQAPAA